MQSFSLKGLILFPCLDCKLCMGMDSLVLTSHVWWSFVFLGPQTAIYRALKEVYGLLICWRPLSASSSISTHIFCVCWTSFEAKPFIIFSSLFIVLPLQKGFHGADSAIGRCIALMPPSCVQPPKEYQAPGLLLSHFFSSISSCCENGSYAKSFSE